MSSLYLDIEPYVCEWTENLIDAGLIPKGEVWCRSIKDIKPRELQNFCHVHAFNGFAGWAYALRQAGWPDDRPVWTGSCPCQPGSLAGRQEGFEDPRHLWPDWQRLIRKCRPATIFGEQVAGWSDWLNLVRGDLERMGYAVGAAPVQAASAGADHFRDRYWFVVDDTRRERNDGQPRTRNGSPGACGGPSSRGGAGDWDVAHNDIQRSSESWLQRSRELGGTGGDTRNSSSPLAHGDSERSQVPLCVSTNAGSERATAARDPVRGVEYDKSVGWGEGWTESEFRSRGFTATVASIDGSQYIECPDGKWRRLPPPSVRWLAFRLRARIPQLRAIGNSIDVRPATAFIKAFLESENA